MQPSELFNCCTDHAEPDWSEFDGLEIGGCVDDGQGNTEGGKSILEAQFFTVFGHRPCGEFEAITDIDTLGRAIFVAAELERRSRLPLNLHPTL